MSDVRLVQKDGVAHRLRHTLRPPLPPPLAAVRLVAVGKCFASKVDDENLTVILGERSQFGREVEFLDFCMLSEYNSVRQT